MTRLACLPLVVLVILWPGTVGAEMYKWVDAGGITHYSNSPPPEGIRAKSSWDEVGTVESDRADRKAREAAIIKKTEAANRQAEIDAAVAEKQKAGQEALDAGKAEKEALGESISKKRRYIKRRGKTDINKIKRLNKEMEALKKDPTADPESIKELEAEIQETKDNVYRKSGRGRKGTREEVERYRRLEMEIQDKEVKEAAGKKK